MDAETISKLVKGIKQKIQIAEIRINTDPGLLVAVQSLTPPFPLRISIYSIMVGIALGAADTSLVPVITDAVNRAHHHSSRSWSCTMVQYKAQRQALQQANQGICLPRPTTQAGLMVSRQLAMSLVS
jgi:hypothetical protein